MAIRNTIRLVDNMFVTVTIQHMEWPACSSSLKSDWVHLGDDASCGKVSGMAYRSERMNFFCWLFGTLREHFWRVQETSQNSYRQPYRIRRKRMCNSHNCSRRSHTIYKILHSCQIRRFLSFTCPQIFVGRLFMFFV